MNEDILSLQPQAMDQDRREFLVTKLAAGFAAAVLPITAQTITTDSEGLEAGEVKIPVSDGSIPAYRAMPAKGTKFPVVLVVRQGDVSKLTNIQEVSSKVVSKVPDSQVMSDLDAAAAWAAKSKGDTSRLGVTGFCWG